MNDYINNIVSRHVDPEMNIQPRLTGVFETSYHDPSILPGAGQAPVVSDASVQTIEPHGLHINDTIPTQPFIEEPAEPFLFDDKEKQSLENPAIVRKEKNEVVKETFFPVMHLKQETGSVQEISSPKNDPTEDKESPLQNNTTLVVNKEFHYELINQLGKDTESDNETVPVIKPGDIDTFNNDDKNKIGKKAGQIHFPPVQPVLRSAGNAVEAIFNYNEGSSVIKVSIGRIEVKAVSSETKTVKATAEKSSRLMMSLDEYLKKRNIAE